MKPKDAVRNANTPAAIEALPPFPQVALLVLELLSDPESETREVVETLHLDGAFAAEMLRVANSSLFAFAREIRTVRHAVTILGHHRLRALTMTVALRVYLMKNVDENTLRDAWSHSMACALVAEQLAQPCQMGADAGYAAGLLHDVGRLALIAASPADYAGFLEAAQRHQGDILELERERFSMDHCEVGLLLAEEWKLPTDLGLAAARHHSPAQEREPTVVTLSRFSCQLADVLGFSAIRPSPKEQIPEIPEHLAETARSLWRLDLGQLRTSLTDRINSVEFTIGLR